MFQNPTNGRPARNFRTNVPKILDLKSSSAQIFSENWHWVPLTFGRLHHIIKKTDFKLVVIKVWSSEAPCKRTQHCWMLHVASVCTPCCMLLDVVACCCAKFETGQTFQPTTPNISFVLWSPKRSATMLDPFARFFQHCRGHARQLRMDHKDLWVVFFPRCTTGPKLVGNCCLRLHTTANMTHDSVNIFFKFLLKFALNSAFWNKL